MGLDRQRWKTILLVAGSSLLSAMVLEAALRALTSFPIHGRLANRVSDPILGYRMDPARADIDDRGFRNAARPTHAEIVALGDSHTFGYNVSSLENWPSQLARATGRSVYNLGLGGYGAYHYCALQDEALALRPKELIAAIYVLNDAADLCGSLEYVTDRSAWEATTGVPWTACDALSRQVDLDAGQNSTAEWVSARSASASLLRWAYGTQRMRRILRGVLHESNEDVIVRDTQGGRYYFRASTTRARSRLVDSRDPAVLLGAKQLERFFENADRRMRDIGGRFVVLFVPVRERVFASDLASGRQGRAVATLLAAEAGLRERLQARLATRGIAFVDAFDEVSAAQASGERVYPDGDDDHPTVAGYRAYAAAVERLVYAHYLPGSGGRLQPARLAARSTASIRRSMLSSGDQEETRLTAP